jgi:carbon-monoxide dehydrogenase medium subunit
MKRRFPGLLQSIGGTNTMKPFEFLEPKNLKEACSLLAQHSEEARILAGGQSLRPIMRQGFLAPKYLINIKGLSELEYIKEDANGLKIGALTIESDIENSPIIKEKFPLLIEMEGFLGAPQIRNWGTIGGSLAFSDPAGDPAVALIALNAKVKAVSTRGEREIPVEEFEIGYLESALEPDEILTEITIPYLPPHSGGAFTEEVVRAGDLGIAIVAAVVTLNGGKAVKDARIVLGAQSVSPFRAKEAEQAAIGKKAGDNLDDVAKVLTRRALNLAISRAQTA